MFYKVLVINCFYFKCLVNRNAQNNAKNTVVMGRRIEKIQN